MTATPTKAVKATLSFDVRVQVSVQATEAKWKKLTKEYRDPDESWTDEAESVIDTFSQSQNSLMLLPQTAEGMPSE